jgi:hypothetical protein
MMYGAGYCWVAWLDAWQLVGFLWVLVTLTCSSKLRLHVLEMLSQLAHKGASSCPRLFTAKPCSHKMLSWCSRETQTLSPHVF